MIIIEIIAVIGILAWPLILITKIMDSYVEHREMKKKYRNSNLPD